MTDAAEIENQPQYQEILAEADWNHLIFDPGLVDRPYRVHSEFPIAGPFRYQHVPANRRAAAWVQQMRAAVWRSRSWLTEAGLQRYARPARKRPKTWPCGFR